MEQETKRVMQEWDAEVEREMRELIEAGIPPYDAAESARNIVSNRRRNKKWNDPLPLKVLMGSKSVRLHKDIGIGRIPNSSKAVKERSVDET